MRARLLNLIVLTAWLFTACAAPTAPPVVITVSRAPLATATASPTHTDAPPATSPAAPSPTPPGPPLAPTLTLSRLAEWDAPPAHSLAWFPNGERLAVASERGVYLYDAATLQAIRYLEMGHAVTAAAITHAEDLLVASTTHGFQKWDLRSGQPLTLPAALIDRPELSNLSHLSFSPDDHLLAAVGYGLLSVWDITAGQVLYAWYSEAGEGLFPPPTAVFSRDGRLLAASIANEVVIVSLETGVLWQQIKGFTTSPTHLAFSHDDRVLIAASGSHISFWDTATGQLRRERSLAGFAAVSLSRDGLRLAGTGDGFIALSDSVTGTPWLRLMAHTGYASHFAYSPNGTRLAALDANGTLWVWQVDIGRVAATLDRHHPQPTMPALSPDGQTLAWGSGHRVWLWAYASGDPPQPVFSQPDLVTSVAFSPDGLWLVTGGAAPWSRRAEGGATAAARVWDLTTSRLRDTLPSQGYAVGALAFSPDSQTIATGGEDTLIRLWHLPTGRLLRELSGYHTSPIQLAFSPDGQQLLSLASAYEGCYGHCLPGSVPWREESEHLRLWDLNTGEGSSVLEAGQGGCSREMAVLSPTGQQIVGTLCPGHGLWSLRANQPRQRWLLPEPVGTPGFLAFSPAGRSLAAITPRTGSVLLINAETGALITRAFPPNGPVTWLTFLDNGRLLAWSHAHGTLRLWHGHLTYP